jgi:hypothetical protein
MRQLRQVGAVLGLLLVASSVASAQQRTTATRATQRSAATAANPWEFGADARLSLGLDDQGNRLEIPVGNLRAGYHFSDVLSIEPFGSIQYVDPEIGDSFTFYELGVGALYHFSTSRTQRQFYARPYLELLGISGGGNGESELGIGIGGGVKWPRLNGRMALRGEANVLVMDANTSLNFLFGLSFYTR